MYIYIQRLHTRVLLLLFEKFTLKVQKKRLVGIRQNKNYSNIYRGIQNVPETIKYGRNIDRFLNWIYTGRIIATRATSNGLRLLRARTRT